MKSTFQSNRSLPTVDSMMTPMIDVVFLLLIFFLTASSFQKLEKQLPSASASPPSNSEGSTSEKSNSTTTSDFDDIVIKIATKDAGLLYTIQNQPVSSLNELKQRLITILQIRNDVPIIIDPTNEVPAGEAISVYDLVRSQGSLSVFLVAR